MTFIIEPPVGALNIAINTGLAHMNGVSSVLLGALVAGMMAVDMGGPLNKAAYVFGTASIAAGNYNIMAAVDVYKRQREKLLSYLSAEAQKHGTSEFDIPFSRQQLADYLSVERSAMSTELGK